MHSQKEDRRLGFSHIYRERSGFLATERQLRDINGRRVGRLVFDNRHGVLDEEFADAHHIVPLNRLKFMVR